MPTAPGSKRSRLSWPASGENVGAVEISTVERHRRDVGEREDRALARPPEREVGRRRRRRRENHVVEPVEQVRRTLRVEQADRRDVAGLDAGPARRPLRPDQLAAVPDRLRVAELTQITAVRLEVAARGDRPAVRVAHAPAHDEYIARVLLERLVRARVQRVCFWIPDDLVDADQAPDARLAVDFGSVAVARSAD